MPFCQVTFDGLAGFRNTDPNAFRHTHTHMDTCMQSRRETHVSEIGDTVHEIDIIDAKIVVVLRACSRSPLAGTVWDRAGKAARMARFISMVPTFFVDAD